MRLCLTVIFIHFFLFPLSAQQFEWASSGDNLNGGIRASVLDAEGNMIVAGVANMPNYYTGEQQLYSSSGDSQTIHLGDFMFLASYAPNGKINWVRELQGADDPVGMGADKDGNLVVLAYNRSNPRFKDPDVRVGKTKYFTIHFTPQGKITRVVTDSLGLIKRPMHFSVTASSDYLFSQSEYTRVNDGNKSREDGFYSLYKLNADLKVVWKHSMQRVGSHGTYTAGMLVDEAPDGDVYAAVSVQEGFIINGKRYTPPVLDSVHQYNPPFEAYLISFTRDGKLKWVRNSGGKTIFSALKASASGVYLGGNVSNNHNFFGKRIDTSDMKRMVLAAFDKKGKLKWAETTRAHTITALATDREENIYAILESKLGWPQKLVLYHDTLTNVFETMLLASFDAKGKYRWVKHTKLPMSRNEPMNLLTDDCGNLFVSGELWWVMKAEMKWFDAALVKGYGYGPMPFAGKIKNTLPAFVAEQKECVISPAPWTIMNYPNPFQSNTTIQYRITYDDPKVSLFLYNISGKLIKALFTGKQHQQGVHTLSFSSSGLSRGVYIMVLRGTEAVATERMVVQ